jgi:malate/lactate dehydrogenase
MVAGGSVIVWVIIFGLFIVFMPFHRKAQRRPVSDIYLSIPTVINRKGVHEVLRLLLEEKEIEGFRRSTSILKDIAQSLGL